MRLKSLMKSLLGVVITAVIIYMVSYIQHDRVNATVYSVSPTEIVFETENGNLYAIEHTPKSPSLMTGDAVILIMFDYEDFNPRNDEIVKVIK